MKIPGMRIQAVVAGENCFQPGVGSPKFRLLASRRLFFLPYTTLPQFDCAGRCCYFLGNPTLMLQSIKSHRSPRCCVHCTAYSLTRIVDLAPLTTPTGLDLHTVVVALERRSIIYQYLTSPHIRILLIHPSPRLSCLLVSRTSTSHRTLISLLLPTLVVTTIAIPPCLPFSTLLLVFLDIHPRHPRRRSSRCSIPLLLLLRASSPDFQADLSFAETRKSKPLALFFADGQQQFALRAAISEGYGVRPRTRDKLQPFAGTVASILEGKEDIVRKRRKRPEKKCSNSRVGLPARSVTGIRESFGKQEVIAGRAKTTRDWDNGHLDTRTYAMGFCRGDSVGGGSQGMLRVKPLRSRRVAAN
ncbi:hypothetical protein B0H13DRAFT_2389996 [Mycena leptocephala]|nr:hypothetical protein B0H13DRAFT_2389996 [Mycena leptocephala]